MAKGQLSNQIKNQVGALNSNIGMAKQQMQQAVANANLPDLASYETFH